MTTISLCMITKNEEANLKSCLEQAKDFVDEIVIVDTGSTDKTKEIAKQFTSKIFDFKWCDDFSKARNQSLKYATQDWVIYIDADEVVSSADWKKIRELIKAKEVDGYLLGQRNYTFDKTVFGWESNDSYKECKGSGFFVSQIVRLFRNNKKYKFDYRVHETVDKSILADKGKIIESKIPIHHYGYLKESEFLDLKRGKYLKLGLAQIKESPDNPRPCYEVAMIYKKTGKLKEAEKYLEKVVKMNPKYKLALTNLGDVYAALGKKKEAIESYKESIKLKNEENAFINLGMLCFKLGDLKNSMMLLEKSLQINPNNPVAYNNLGLILIKAKKYVAALAVFEKGFEKTKLKKFKEAIDAMKKRFEAPLKIMKLMKEEKFVDLQKYLEGRIKENKGDLIAYTHLGNLFVKLEQQKKAIKVLQDAVKHVKTPDMIGVNLYVNLANLFVESKQIAKAEKTMKEALSLDPKNEFLKKKLEGLQKSL